MPKNMHTERRIFDKHERKERERERKCVVKLKEGGTLRKKARRKVIFLKCLLSA